MGPVEGPFTVSKKIGVAEGRLNGDRVRGHAPPATPWTIIFFESLRMNYQQDPPNNFGLPDGLHGGEHAKGGEYARLVPLAL